MTKKKPARGKESGPARPGLERLERAIGKLPVEEHQELEAWCVSAYEVICHSEGLAAAEHYAHRNAAHFELQQVIDEIHALMPDECMSPDEALSLLGQIKTALSTLEDDEHSAYVWHKPTRWPFSPRDLLS